MGPTDLAAWLAQHAPTLRLVSDIGETPTVPAAAAALGVAPDQIVKTLLFEAEINGDRRTVVVISNGEQRVDKGALAAHLGTSKKRVKLAPAEVVGALVGYAVGGVPPVGHRTALPVLLDASVANAAERFGGVLWAGGGDERTMLCLTLDDLLRLCRPVVLPLSAAAPA